MTSIGSKRSLLPGKALKGLHGEDLTVATAALLTTEEVIIIAKKEPIMEVVGAIIKARGEWREGATAQVLKEVGESPFVEIQDGTLFAQKTVVHHPITEIQDGVILKVTETLDVSLTEPAVTSEELKKATREATIHTFEGTANRLLEEIQIVVIAVKMRGILEVTARMASAKYRIKKKIATQLLCSEFCTKTSRELVLQIYIS